MPNGEDRRNNVGLAAAAVGIAVLLFVMSRTEAAENDDIDIPDVTPPDPQNPSPVPQISIQFLPRYITGVSFLVTGEESFDPNGTIVNYFWSIFREQADGTRNIINETTGESFNFNPTREGKYFFELTVEDNQGAVKNTITQSPITVEKDDTVPEIITPANGRSQLGVSSEKRNNLISMLNIELQTSFNYRGESNYLFNIGGEILPNRPPVDDPEFIFDPNKDVKSLADWISQGGVWIDYCGWPMLYEGGTSTFNSFTQKPDKWNNFMEFMGVDELGFEAGNIVPQSRFFLSGSNFENFGPDNGYPNLINSLLILGSVPSQDKFIPETTNENVPFIQNNVYSMFAIRFGQGIYFYSNRFLDVQDYVDFILRIHG